MPKFKLNDEVPTFTLPRVSGDEFNFSNALENNDSWHLIIYFRGSWCPACMGELDELEESKGYFEKQNIQLTTITHDDKDELTKVVNEHGFSFPVLIDENFEFLESYDVHYHNESAPYEDHGAHGEPAYFLTDENGKLLYQQRQTSPFGRPHPNELRKIIKYIKNNLK
ncbi:redoxin domain-containing protein [Halobacillus locisalis]|uniref:Redoxin domain-containing protein n=1 Tax=Halobacillus locisalis TaxID=220753 RepID=A0A838CUF8_9BACI|nr:redoxin domain-containing protein [Halobacillus locisalis]MBA2175449.1 redoxin domain-containing protein [Halobacillus locisalis]